MQLRDHCWAHGVDVRRVQTFDAHQSARPSNRAVAELLDNRELQRAIPSLDGTVVNGRVIFVREDRGQWTKGKGNMKAGDYAPWRGDGFDGRRERQGRSDWNAADGQLACNSCGSDRSWGDRGLSRTEPGWGWRADRVNENTARSRSPDEDRGERPPLPRRGVSGKGGFRHVVADQVPRLAPGTPHPLRLFADDLPLNVDCKMLMGVFKGRFRVHVNVLHFLEGPVPSAYGIIEFLTREDALEANLMFNGVLIGETALRLQGDRGEFDELVARKRLDAGDETYAERWALPLPSLEFRRTVQPPPPPPPPPSRSRAHAKTNECVYDDASCTPAGFSLIQR